MHKTTAFAILLSACCATQAADTGEEKFRRCVELKDIVLLIAERADEGVSRSDLKAKVADPVINGTIEVAPFV